MNREQERHMAIRIMILEEIEQRGWDFSFSHGDHGEIHFYHISDGHPKVHLADPDILVMVDNKFLTIEIEMSLQPKHLLGVSKAISLCTHYRIGGREIIPLGTLSFILVGESEQINKPRSHRPTQIRLINQALGDMLGFEYSKVITEKEIERTLDEWERTL